MIRYVCFLFFLWKTSTRASERRGGLLESKLKTEWNCSAVQCSLGGSLMVVPGGWTIHVKRVWHPMAEAAQASRFIWQQHILMNHVKRHIQETLVIQVKKKKIYDSRIVGQKGGNCSGSLQMKSLHQNKTQSVDICNSDKSANLCAEMRHIFTPAWDLIHLEGSATPSTILQE